MRVVRSEGPERDLYPLTHPQKRVHIVEGLYPGTSIHNLGGPIRIKGSVNFNALEEAINIFIQQNDGVRIRLVDFEGQVKQYIADYERHELEYVDFSRSADPESDLESWIKNEASKPFTMNNSKLYKFILFKLNDNDNGYFAKLHHIISDGWSIKLMTEQIAEAYVNIIERGSFEPEKKESYVRFIEEEIEYLESERFQKNKMFWLQKFEHIRRGVVQHFDDQISGDRYIHSLDIELSREIRAFIKERRYSVNTFFTAVYMLYEYLAKQNEEVIIGQPLLNRSGKKEKQIFGMFTSTMPFKYMFDRNDSVVQTISMIQRALTSCFFNQRYPYNLLMEDLRGKLNNNERLFGAFINCYNTKLVDSLDSKQVENMEFYNGSQIFPLQIVIKEWSQSGGFQLEFDYRKSYYSSNEIRELVNNIVYLCRVILATPDMFVYGLSLPKSEEFINKVYEFNNTKAYYPAKSVVQLFEEQAKATPEKISIKHRQRKLSYKELNEWSNELARQLISIGIRRGAAIGVLMNCSIEAVIAMLAVMKAGGAYVPIDPQYPVERIKYLLSDSHASILLTNSEVSREIEYAGMTINIGERQESRNDRDNLDLDILQSDLAYIIYTSGSTGLPKGAMIDHRGLTNYVWWAKEQYIEDNSEVFPLFTSIAFDLTVTSIFTPLVSGNLIVVYNESEKQYPLITVMEDNFATVIKLTPSQLSLLATTNYNLSSLRKLIIGGEELKVPVAREIYDKFGGSVKLFNEYGPTETVVGCMIHEYDRHEDTAVTVPIGKPAANVQIYILNESLVPVPIGHPGQLYISGAGVARGYFNNDELTRQRFIINPFISGSRMYASGDLARFNDNQRIEYLGRSDSQVKIRGHRIELSEIECCLLTFDGITQAVAMARSNENGSKHIYAYYVSTRPVTDSVLVEYLKLRLPNYSLPTFINRIDNVPLNQNGKVDYANLPHPLHLAPEQTSEGNVKLVEKVILGVLKEVLKNESISLSGDFYRYGGDSIKAIQVQNSLKEKGYLLQSKEVLTAPTIYEMAMQMRSVINNKSSDMGPAQGWIQHVPSTAWFFRNVRNHRDTYSISLMLNLLTDTLDISKLESIWNSMIRVHDSLRINYDEAEGRLFYNNSHSENWHKIPIRNISGLSMDLQEKAVQDIYIDALSSFRMEYSLLCQLILLDIGTSGYKMLLICHHLVMDGVSLRILLNDITELYLNDEEPSQWLLERKTNTFQDWAVQLGASAANINNDDLHYWSTILTKQGTTFGESKTGAPEVCDTVIKIIDERYTDKLVTQANLAYNTETKDLLIAAFALTLSTFSASNEVVFEIEGHGRDSLNSANIDVGRTVGWFTVMHPFVTQVNQSDLPQMIKSTKEELRSIAKRGVQYGQLLCESRLIHESEKEYIRFNYLGDFTATLDNPLLSLADEGILLYEDRSHLTSQFDVNVFHIHNKLHIRITYGTESFDRETIGEFISLFQANAIKIISHCSERYVTDFTPSDFSTISIEQQELDSLFE